MNDRTSFLNRIPPVLLSAALAVTLYAGESAAQVRPLPEGFNDLSATSSTSQDRAVVERAGVLLGAFRLRAALGASLGYDSNVHYTARDEVSSPLFSVSPRLLLTNRDHARSLVALSLFAGGEHRRLLNAALNPQQRAATAGMISGDIEWRAGDHWSLSGRARASRDVQPGDDGQRSYIRDTEGGTARVRLTSPHSRTEASLEYSLALEQYPKSDLSASSIDNTFRLSGGLELVEPIVATLSISQALFRYVEDVPGRHASNPLRGLIGARFLLGSSSLHVAGGYGAGFFEGGRSPKLPIASVDLTVRAGRTALGRIQIQRDFATSLYGSYHVFEAAQASWRQQVTRWLSAEIGGRYEHRTYACPPDHESGPQRCFLSSSGEERVDHLVGATADVRIAAAQWFSADISYQFLANLGDFPIAPDSATTTEFSKHRVLGLLTASY